MIKANCDTNYNTINQFTHKIRDNRRLACAAFVCCGDAKLMCATATSMRCHELCARRTATNLGIWLGHLDSTTSRQFCIILYIMQAATHTYMHWVRHVILWFAFAQLRERVILWLDTHTAKLVYNLEYIIICNYSRLSIRFEDPRFGIITPTHVHTPTSEPPQRHPHTEYCVK